jgi:hypothetical protein
MVPGARRGRYRKQRLDGNLFFIYMKINPSKLVTANNQRKTASLFVETQRYELLADAAEYPVYSFLRDKDYTDEKGVKILSARKIYLECNDPSEYRVAMELVGSLEHWKMIAESQLCKMYVNDLREELRLRMVMEQIEVMKELAASPGKSQLQAAKFLYDELGGLGRKKAGRPVKARMPEPSNEKEVKEDFIRLGLSRLARAQA